MRPMIAAATLAIALGATDVGAQQVIRGTLFDSLRTNAPVAGAEIVLFGTGRRVTTDADGHFAFEAVTPGAHTVGYWAPWLDSLAVPALRATVQVPASGEVSDVLLATPSRATAQRSLCGALLGGEQAVVIGEVHDAGRRPIASVPVQAWWNETLIGTGQLERRTLATAAETDALGMFALCGVPRGAELQVYAEAPGAMSAMSATLAIVIDAPILRQDLTVGPATALMTVTGRLHGADTSAVPGAVIALRADSAISTLSAADGTFQLRVPARSSQLLIRAVGYAPQERVIEPAAASSSEGAAFRLGDIRLRSLQELGVVEITGAPMSERRLAFEERRKFNFQGTFIDDEELARMPKVTTHLLFARVNRSIMDHGTFKLMRGSGYCRPRIFVEGVDEGVSTDLKNLLPIAKRIEVYRAAFAPPRFTDFDGCGALVIWLH